MRGALGVSLLCVLGVMGCRTRETAANVAPASSPPARVAAAPVKSKIDVCNLLTSDNLKAVQGEAFKESQRADRMDGEFVVAQCYYAMPTTVNSVVVNVTTAKDEPGARSPKAFWEQTFREADEKERDGKADRDREKEKPAEPREHGEEGEAKEASPPERVKGLGDEAFWVASPVGGALYVLKNELFVRVSVGGSGDQQTKLSKSKTLAQDILKKL